jgi:hypothetical protein
MKKIILLFLLLSNIAGAQTSGLYSRDRRLRADRSFRIDAFTFATMPAIEKELLPRIYNSIKYPAEARYNNIAGAVIAEIVFSNGINDDKSYDFKIVKSTNKVFDNMVLRGLKELSGYMNNELLLPKGRFVFYVPISFKVNPNHYESQLKKNGVVSIEVNQEVPVITTVQ